MNERSRAQVLGSYYAANTHLLGSYYGSIRELPLSQEGRWDLLLLISVEDQPLTNTPLPLNYDCSRKQDCLLWTYLIDRVHRYSSEQYKNGNENFGVL